MNPSAITIIAVCALAHVASAQYGGGYQQRKMAPVAQSYGQQQQASYGAAEQSAYGAGGAMSSYGAPSAATVSSYDTGAAASNAYGHGKQSAGYGKSAAGYGAAAGYGKSAARYEEPSYPPMPFAWGYDINDGYGGAQYHKESGDEYGKRTGSYGYTDAYGVYRQVDYVADEHGFRATIKTNEPGTANESPADVELHAYEPPSNYYAGNTNSYGKQQQQQSYGASSSQYGQQALGGNGYGRQQSSYGQQQQGSYQQAQRGYGKQQQSYGAAQGRQMGYGNAEQYASSAVAPAYSKAPKRAY